jgi:hypothetical protein
MIARFQDALAGQRRLRAERDLQRAQLHSRLEHLVNLSGRLTVLRERLGEVNI